MTTENQSNTTQPIDVESVGQFIELLFAWHEKRVKTLEHLLSIPDGTLVSVNSGEPLTLTGDALKGFQTGLYTALSELGTLPFHATCEECAELKAAANDEPIQQDGKVH